MRIKTSKILSFGILLIIINFNTEASITLNKEGSPYHFTEDFVISTEDSLIIEEGTIIILSPYVKIITNGVILSRGMPDDRVSILPEIEGVGWDKILIDCPGKTSVFEYTDVVDGAIYSNYCDLIYSNTVFYNSQILEWNNPLTFVYFASVDIQDCAIYGSYMGEGFQMLNSEEVLVRNCYFSRIPDAVELTNINGGRISNNRFEDIPDDAIDLNNCSNTLLDSNIIINVYDRGFELGSENNGNSENITISRNVIIACGQGVIFKENSYGKIINNTFYKNTIGVKCIEDNSPRTGSSVDIQNCIFSASLESDIYVDDNSEVNLSYNLSDTENLPGSNNLLDDPLFGDADNYNFRIQEASSCINAGNPESNLDPDSTISDIGAFYFNTNKTNDNFRDINIYPNPFLKNFVISSGTYVISDIKLFLMSGIEIPVIIEEEYTFTNNTYQITTSKKIDSYQPMLCEITINGKSKSFMLLHQ